MTSKEAQYLGCVEFEGWDYQEAPPADVADLRYLQSQKPWLALCCILERAKSGEFSAVHLLPSLARNNPGLLADTAHFLLACVGSMEDLQILEHEILREDGDRMTAADCAVQSGSLQFLGSFIAGHRVAFGETTRMAMEEGLSNLLLSDPESNKVIECLTADRRDEGEEELRAMARTQRATFGDKASMYRGRPLTLGAIIDDIEPILHGRDEQDFAYLRSLMTRVQTMAGFSQQELFDEETQSWNELAIRKTLKAAKQLQGVPGMRYFFGHPVPL